jgi:hypothetical protein
MLRLSSSAEALSPTASPAQTEKLNGCGLRARLTRRMGPCPSTRLFSATGRGTSRMPGTSSRLDTNLPASSSRVQPTEISSRCWTLSASLVPQWSDGRLLLRHLGRKGGRAITIGRGRQGQPQVPEGEQGGRLLQHVLGGPWRVPAQGAGPGSHGPASRTWQPLGRRSCIVRRRYSRGPFLRRCWRAGGGSRRSDSDDAVQPDCLSRFKSLTPSTIPQRSDNCPPRGRRSPGEAEAPAVGASPDGRALSRARALARTA